MYDPSVKVASISCCYNLVPLRKFQSRKKDQFKRLKLYQTMKEKKKRLSKVLFNSEDLPSELSEYHGVKTSDKEIEMADFEENVKGNISSIN